MCHSGRLRVVRSAGLLLAGCLLLTACTGAQHRAAPTGTAPPTRSRSAPLVAAVPTGTTNCGAWLISATTLAGTMGLLSCAGQAGLPHPKLIQVANGGAVLITGIPATASLSITPAGLLAINGSTLTARGPGTAVITIHNWSCLPLTSGTQPHSCTLARVQVT
jgi:hypothetical protein